MAESLIVSSDSDVCFGLENQFQMKITYIPHRDDEHNQQTIPDEWTNYVNYFDFIPDELLLKLLQFLTPRERLVLERVNHRLRRICCSLIDDYGLVESPKLPCATRRKFILKYPNIQCFTINDADAVSEDFALKLARMCQRIETFSIISVNGLDFVAAYAGQLLKLSVTPLVRKLEIKVRPDATGLSLLFGKVLQNCQMLDEVSFDFVSRIGHEEVECFSQKFKQTECKFMFSGSEDVDTSSILDDNDVFWNFYN